MFLYQLGGRPQQLKRTEMGNPGGSYKRKM